MIIVALVYLGMYFWGKHLGYKEEKYFIENKKIKSTFGYALLTMFFVILSGIIMALGLRNFSIVFTPILQGFSGYTGGTLLTILTLVTIPIEQKGQKKGKQKAKETIK